MLILHIGKSAFYVHQHMYVDLSYKYPRHLNNKEDKICVFNTLVLKIQRWRKVATDTAFKMLPNPGEQFGMGSAGARRSVEIEQVAPDPKEGQESHNLSCSDPLSGVYQSAA